jgi:hypothetical protein
MNRLLIAWMCVVLVSPAGWARQGASPDVENPVEAESPPARTAVADVLVCIDIDASPGSFHDLTQKYVDAFTAAGATTIATAATEVSGGSINFPPGLTAANYPVVVVLGSDNWWSGPNNIDPTDEAALAAYLDTGGRLMLVGQDYMYGAHPDMNAPNPCYGFPRDYLGLDVCYQDFDTPGRDAAAGRLDPRSTEAMLIGTVSFVLSAMVVVILAMICFPNLGYFMTDRASTTRTAGNGLDYEGQFASGTGVLIFNQTRGFKTIWSGVELAGAGTDDFNAIIAALYGWLNDYTPVERTSWTAVKAMYR